MKRTFRDTAIIVVAMLGLFVHQAGAEPQTRFYDARGNSIGTASPQGDGSVRYYDSRGNSVGTSTASPGTGTTFYGPGGNVTGRASTPGAVMPSFQGGRR